jgi:hypothetical protein
LAASIASQVRSGKSSGEYLSIGEGPLHFGLGAQVRADPDGPVRAAQLARDLGGGGRVQVQHGHRGARCGQRTGDHAAERPASAGHHRDSPGQIEQCWQPGHLVHPSLTESGI